MDPELSGDRAGDVAPKSDAIVLRPSRGRQLLLAIFCGSSALLLGGTSIGVAFWMRARGAEASQVVLMYCLGILAFVFFTLLTGVALIVMRPSVSNLKLDLHGFTVRSLSVVSSCRWEDVDRFDAIRLTRRNTFVCFRFRPGFEGQDPKVMLQLANLMSRGYHGMLPNNYGLAADELANLMNMWKARAVTRTS